MRTLQRCWRRCLDLATLPMAQTTRVEGRLQAILGRRDRAAVSRRVLWLSLALAGTVLLLLASLRTQSAGDASRRTADRQTAVPTSPALAWQRPPPQPAVTAANWQGHLPDGVTVRLVGVSENPSRGKAWWTPDGASGQAAPYASCQNEDHVTTMKVQELAVRLAGLPNAATDFAVLADGSGSCNLSRPVSATGHPADPSLQAVVAEYPKSAATGGLYFGVADGPWQTAASRKFRPDGLDGGQSWTSGAAVVISASKSVDRPLIVSVAHDVQGMDTRIVAVDRRGRTLTPELLDRGGTSTNGFSGTLTLDQALQDYHNVSQSLVTFPGLPLKDIREVRFQTRPYQWVRFQGIALQSNQAPRAPVRKGV